MALLPCAPSAPPETPHETIQRLTAELREARDQQAATTEILQVINSSPGDLTPVFDAILEKALSLCEAAHGHLTVYQDGHFHCAAAQGDPRFVEWFRRRPPYGPGPGTTMEKIVKGAGVVQVADVTNDEAYRLGDPVRRAAAEIGGSRTVVSVALRKEDTLFGAVTVYRQEVRLFTDKEIALLQNFAAQAVIAMENARLLTETREALEQQTATAEILRVISSSPTNVQPTLDAIAAAATSLTDAKLSAVVTYDGELMHLRALSGFAISEAERVRALWPIPADHGTATGRAILTRQIVQIDDLSVDPGYSHPRLAQVSGRTVLAVPMLRDGIPIGAINVQRRDVQPFTDKQVDLFKTFADQAVIAIENVRLFNETKEALEQQTATAEVLQVINSSPGDLAPVFDAILEKAHTLCDTAHGSLQLWDGEKFRGVATRGFSEAMINAVRRGYRPGPNFPSRRIVEGERVVHCVDVAEIDDPIAREGVELSGSRTMLYAALRKDDVLLGQIVSARQEVRPFSEKQIALVENFAAQAVIAMENARLINETREALEQQTATAEVLQVINSSPGDLGPVFDTLVDTAARLCNANMAGLAIRDGDAYRYVASRSIDPAWDTYVRGLSFTPGRETVTGRTLLERRVVHVADLAADPEHTVPEIVSVGGIRTFLGVPLLQEGEPIGVLALLRHQVEPFTDRQIALVETFAAQAVIAMENARLLTETREALEQQTATAEVLQVINSSPGDLTPVFDAILEKAHTLCGVASGGLIAIEGGRYRPLAVRGDPGFAEYWMQQGWVQFSTGAPAQLRRGEPVQFPNLTLEDRSRWSDQTNRLLDLSGTRCMLLVPLRKDDELFGAITALRKEALPFSDKEIALLQNFAAQAVIAMENARLITETREALEQQTATAEVLQVINSSPGDLAPVFDAMLDKALDLCGAAFGTLWTRDGELFYAAALRRVPAPYAEFLARGPVRATVGSTTGLGSLLYGSTFFHLPDATAHPGYQGDNPGARALIELGGARTTAGVPLRKDGALVGAITIYRQEVRPFTDKQIALLQNFAAQAVIAMENARLLTETREALEQQTATAEVLQVINSSPGDLAPVFDTMLDKAMRLCEASFGALFVREGELSRAVATRGLPDRLNQFVRQGFVSSPPDRNPIFRGDAIAHVLDLTKEPLADQPGRAAAVELGGARTMLGVALRKDDILLGTFSVFRQEVRPFSDKQIALLQNFAAQAVIAMENARLITETREALEQQTATAEVLQVINSSPGDLAPVFDAMLAKFHSLCGADNGSLLTYDGKRFWPVAWHGVQLADPGSEGIDPDVAPSFGRIVRGERLDHIHDMAEFAAQVADDATRQRLTALVENEGIRTQLVVALRNDNLLLGAITANRKVMRPFSEKEIALLQNFAAQAVIAMENARLINETREALEQQTATAEVLQVINASPGDLAPVFDAMLEKAMRLCGAAYGHLYTFDGERFHPAAMQGEPSVVESWRQAGPILPTEGGSSPLARVLRGERIVSMDDFVRDEAYRSVPKLREFIDTSGIHSFATVALTKEKALFGAISVYRREVRPFSDTQIALLQNFAAQAVIAMENARLLTETREALEQQTATAEVLQVINASPGDLAPVFDAMLEKALRLCEAAYGNLLVYDSGLFSFVSIQGDPDLVEHMRAREPFAPMPSTALRRIVEGEDVAHIADILKSQEYHSKSAVSRAGRHRRLSQHV